MKLFWILALIINLTGYGEIPAEGADITFNSAEKDLLTGKDVMSLEGSLLCNGGLTVTITRSEAGLSDQFCCGQCINGNGETTEELTFTPEGLASWFVHYYPAPGSDVQVTYLFTDGSASRELRVHYIYEGQGVEAITGPQSPTTRKIIRDGLLFIEHNNTIYHL